MIIQENIAFQLHYRSMAQRLSVLSPSLKQDLGISSKKLALKLASAYDNRISGMTLIWQINENMNLKSINKKYFQFCK